VHEESQVDLQDAAEFFRRGDDGDYADADSLSPTGIGLARDEGEDENEPTDPALLEQRIARRARFTRWVRTGIGGLAFATLVTCGVRALSRSRPDLELVTGSNGFPPAAQVQPARGAAASVHEIEGGRPESEPAVLAVKPPLSARVLLAEAPNTASPKAATAKGNHHAVARRALARARVAEPAGNAALPALTVAKAQTQSTKDALRPPTARFAD